MTDDQSKSQCGSSYWRVDGLSDGVVPFTGRGVAVSLEEVLTSCAGCDLEQKKMNSEEKKRISIGYKYVCSNQSLHKGIIRGGKKKRREQRTEDEMLSVEGGKGTVHPNQVIVLKPKEQPDNHQVSQLVCCDHNLTWGDFFLKTRHETNTKKQSDWFLLCCWVRTAQLSSVNRTDPCWSRAAASVCLLPGRRFSCSTSPSSTRSQRRTDEPRPSYLLPSEHKQVRHQVRGQRSHIYIK